MMFFENLKFSLQTLGCKVNQYETQQIRENLLGHGFFEREYENADIIIINSCTVTAESDRKTRQFLNKSRKKHPSAILVLTGCVLQAGATNAHKFDADIIMGNANNHLIVDLIIQFLNTKKQIIKIETHDKTQINAYINNFHGRTRAYLKIQDGCDRFCSYCIVPHARGRVRSKTLSIIKKEAETLSQNGFSEILLVGINLSAYEYNLAESVRTVCSVKKIKRVRLGSLEPDQITDEMLDMLKNEPKFADQFHLSLQSGCDRILKLMNRQYDTVFYKNLVEKIRKIFPNAGITTDIMVGFPSETQEDHKQSIEFVKQINFTSSHVFTYSPRPNTPAAIMDGQLSNAVKKKRSAEMIKLTDHLTKQFLISQKNKTLRVLFESYNKGINEGHAGNYVPVRVESDQDLHGQFCDVKIIKADFGFCYGFID